MAFYKQVTVDNPFLPKPHPNELLRIDQAHPRGSMVDCIPAGVADVAYRLDWRRVTSGFEPDGAERLAAACEIANKEAGSRSARDRGNYDWRPGSVRRLRLCYLRVELACRMAAANSSSASCRYPLATQSGISPILL